MALQSVRPESLKGHLDLLLLATVRVRPAHGYAIVAALRELSRDTFDIPEGTIYPALYRLERARLLASDWSEVGGRRRRVYRLTAAGGEALGTYLAEWNSLRSGVEAVLEEAMMR